MNLENFSKKLNLAIKNKTKDETLLSRELKLTRGDYLYSLISYTNTIINYLSFKNEILFVDGKKYIKINDIYLEIVNRYFLKNVGQSYFSQAGTTINFLDKFKFKPNIVLDVGSCWGEYSLILGKHFPNSSIYSIEGSENNYKILCNNISSKLNNVDNIKPFHHIVSDNNNKKYIKNSISTMNHVKNEINQEDKTYTKVVSKTLKHFLFENNLDHIDFLKLDIEGHEINLLDDLLNLKIKYGQIEIINTNSFDKNFKFLKLLNQKYNLIDSKNFNNIDIIKLKSYLEEKFKQQIAFDFFIISRNI